MSTNHRAPTASKGKHIFTPSGITLTPLRVPQPRTYVSPVEWVHKTSNTANVPFDWEAAGLGPNLAFEDEIFRGRVPVQFGAGLALPELPTCTLLPEPIFFTENGRGAAMDEVLRYGHHPRHLEQRGAQSSTKVKMHAEKFLLRIQWPGAGRDWIYEISPDGTYGSIVLEVARAYKKFFECDAPKHDWGEHTRNPWYFANINVSTLRLQGLYWVEQRGPMGSPMAIYEADVQMVFKVELSNDLALFLSQ